MSMSRQHLGISSNGCTQTMAFTSVYPGATSSGHSFFGVCRIRRSTICLKCILSFERSDLDFKVYLLRTGYRTLKQQRSGAHTEDQGPLRFSCDAGIPGRHGLVVQSWGAVPQRADTWHGQWHVWRTLKLRECRGTSHTVGPHADLADHRDVPASRSVRVSA